MSIIKISILGLVTVLLAIQFKSIKAEYSSYIIIVSSMLIFFYGLRRMSQIIDVINKIGNQISIASDYVGLLLKIIGVAYICEFSSDICKDSGYSAIANQIQIFGKLSILVISMPVFLDLFDTIGGIL